MPRGIHPTTCSACRPPCLTMRAPWLLVPCHPYRPQVRQLLLLLLPPTANRASATATHLLRAAHHKAIHLCGGAHHPLAEPVHKHATPPVLSDHEVHLVRLQQVANDLQSTGRPAAADARASTRTHTRTAVGGVRPVCAATARSPCLPTSSRRWWHSAQTRAAGQTLMRRPGGSHRLLVSGATTSQDTAHTVF